MTIFTCVKYHVGPDGQKTKESIEAIYAIAAEGLREAVSAVVSRVLLMTHEVSAEVPPPGRGMKEGKVRYTLSSGPRFVSIQEGGEFVP